MVIVDTTVWVDNFDGVHNAETDWLNTGASEQGSHSPQDDRLPDCDILHSRGVLAPPSRPRLCPLRSVSRTLGHQSVGEVLRAESGRTLVSAGVVINSVRHTGRRRQILAGLLHAQFSVWPRHRS